MGVFVFTIAAFLLKSPPPITTAQAAQDGKSAQETVWTFDQLAADISALQNPSFQQGQRLYQQAKCSACHRMNGQGNEFGPDLVQLDNKWNSSRILKHVLEPSIEIHKEFQAHIFELKDGRTIRGLIVAVGPRFIKVIQDPLKSSQTKRIQRDTARNRQKLGTSFMPSGLLNSLSRKEIVDLIAYLDSRGNDQHSLYQHVVK